MTRRDWLQTMGTVALLGRTSLGKAPADVVERIREKARVAQMQPFDTSESAHFVAVGDATDRYRVDALALCEAFADDYFSHFRDKGFAIEWPKEKLPVVVLGGPTSYAAFEKGFADEAIGGHFDLEANWLVTFDFRPLLGAPRNSSGADPSIDNTLTLVHETFHQLSFNTGMLDRKADVPLCLVEGLATYAETWGPKHRSPIGAINFRRRRGLDLAQKAGGRWIPVKRLLADDLPMDEEKTQQVAYAVSSMLIHKLLKDPVRLPQFRDYLKAVQTANNPAQRIPLAEAHFGDLDKLDREIRR